MTNTCPRCGEWRRNEGIICDKCKEAIKKLIDKGCKK